MSNAKPLSGKYLLLITDSDDETYYNDLSSYLPECKTIIKSCNEAREFCLHNKPDIMILNHSAKTSCMEHLRFFKSIYPYIPLIVMTDNGSEDLAVKIFRNGASDYLKMPLDVQELKKRIRNALGKGNIRRRRKSDYVYDAFRSTVQYVNENYNEQITLPRIAKEAGMSISCFERTFKKYMGSTFTIYVNRLRIARAAEMLRNERLSTSEIAFECGFTNQYHFTRVFKKINEVSPRSYRKSLNI